MHLGSQWLCRHYIDLCVGGSNAVLYYRITCHCLRHPPDVRGLASARKLSCGFLEPARSAGGQRDHQKIQCWRPNDVSKETYVIVCDSVLRDLGGSTTCAGRRRTAAGFRDSGTSVTVDAAHREHRPAANRQHGSTSDRQYNPAADGQCRARIEPDQPEHARQHHAAFYESG